MRAFKFDPQDIEFISALMKDLIFLFGEFKGTPSDRNAENVSGKAEDLLEELEGCRVVARADRKTRIALEAKDIELVGRMADAIGLNADEAIKEFDGSRYMFDETESAAEALYLFLRNRVKQEG